jgi:hypothetical protein
LLQPTPAHFPLQASSPISALSLIILLHNHFKLFKQP